MQPKRLIGMCVAAAALAVAGPVAPAFGAGADQTAGNSADSSAENTAATTQGADQSQWSSSNCEAGCGGSGQAQELAQIALTAQDANSEATANQNGVNANVPVSIGGGYVDGGNSAATQTLYNSADSSAENTAATTQGADQSQSSSSNCKFGCGGSGQAQSLEQVALTEQVANSDAKADQKGVNANVPVTIGGGYVDGGNSAATQTLYNSADSSAENTAATTQGADQSQSSSSNCKFGCGGSGQAQSLEQVALTLQDANSEAEAYQNGVNANTPVAIVTPKQGKQVSAKHRGKKSGAPPR